MRFKPLQTDMSWPKYGGTLISPKQNNSEFDFWFVIELIDWEDATGDTSQGKWNVALCSVSPAEAKDQLESAFACCALEDATAEVKANPIVQVECLKSYGVYAQLWQQSGNNYRQLLKLAREQARVVAGLYGFYMDRPQNRIGTSGWRMQKGELGI
jgi:hypothetical protein